MQYSGGWGAARVLEGVTPQKKKGISLKNGAQKLVSFFVFCHDSVFGKNKAHKHRLFGPVTLGTTLIYARGQTQFVPGTNPGCLLILHSGSPVCCPWDKPGERREAENV